MSTTLKPLLPGSTLGVLGGGQYHMVGWVGLYVAIQRDLNTSLRKASKGVMVQIKP